MSLKPGPAFVGHSPINIMKSITRLNRFAKNRRIFIYVDVAHRNVRNLTRIFLYPE